MCYPKITKERESKIINEVESFFLKNKKNSFDVRYLLNEINKTYIVDFNQLKFSVKNDENKKFKMSEDLCVINKNKI